MLFFLGCALQSLTGRQIQPRSLFVKERNWDGDYNKGLQRLV